MKKPKAKPRKRSIPTWLVRLIDGVYQEVSAADAVIVDGVLEFFIGDRRVAAFNSWQGFTLKGRP